MNKWVKIKDEVFFVEEISIQLTIGVHSNIDISLDVEKYPNYSDIFFKKFENREKFNLISKNFEALGTIIKTIDIGKRFLNVSMKSEYTNQTPIDERREILISEILNNQNKKDIK